MRIRPGIATDAEAIAALQVDAWRHDYDGLLDDAYLGAMSVESILPNLRWALEGAPEDWRMWVADDLGRVVGFASSGPTQDADGERSTAEVFAIYADASTDGVAGELLTHVVADLRQRGFRAATQWLFADHIAGREARQRAGWSADGATNAEVLGGEVVATVRYRLRLG